MFWGHLAGDPVWNPAFGGSAPPGSPGVAAAARSGGSARAPRPARGSARVPHQRVSSRAPAPPPPRARACPRLREGAPPQGRPGEERAGGRRARGESAAAEARRGGRRRRRKLGGGGRLRGRADAMGRLHCTQDPVPEAVGGDMQQLNQLGAQVGRAAGARARDGPEG